MTPTQPTVQAEAVFAVGDLVRFRITQATLNNRVCFFHGVVRAAHPSADGPRYDVETPLSSELWQNIHPSHLMKDPALVGQESGGAA